MLTREGGGGLGGRETQGRATVLLCPFFPPATPVPGRHFLFFYFLKKAMGGFRRVRTERESCRQPHGCVALPFASACREAESRFRMKNFREALPCNPLPISDVCCVPRRQRYPVGRESGIPVIRRPKSSSGVPLKLREEGALSMSPGLRSAKRKRTFEGSGLRYLIASVFPCT